MNDGKITVESVKEILKEIHFTTYRFFLATQQLFT